MSEPARDLPVNSPAVEQAVELARHGVITHLTIHGERGAAIVPESVLDALRSAEDAEDAAEPEAAISEPGDAIPLEELEAEFGLPGELADQLPGDAGGEQRVAGGDYPDRGQQVAWRCVFEQEAAGTGAQRREHVLVQVERGQHQDAGAGGFRCGGDLPGGLDAVHAGHPDVHQDHVRFFSGGEFYRLGAGARLADRGEVGRAVYEQARAAPQQHLIVCDQSPDHDAFTRGKRAVTAKPPAGWSVLAVPSSVICTVSASAS